MAGMREAQSFSISAEMRAAREADNFGAGGDSV